MKKRTSFDLRKLISDGADVLTSIKFKSSKKKEKIVLQLIADEMDENGIGFKEAVLNLILNESEAGITRKSTRKQPKIIDSRIQISSEADREDKEAEYVEIAPSDDTLDKQHEKAVQEPVVIDTEGEVKENRSEEKKKELSAEDKESLKQRLLSSYRV